jgi:hypothetical protein
MSVVARYRVVPHGKPKRSWNRRWQFRETEARSIPMGEAALFGCQTSDID